MAAMPGPRRSRSSAIVAITATAAAREASVTMPNAWSTSPSVRARVSTAPRREASANSRPYVVRTVTW